MDCQEFEELSGAYALDALTPEEKRLANEHLAQCSACQKLASELQATVNLLPLSVRLVEHSPLQKEALFARIQSTSPNAQIREHTRFARRRPLRRRTAWRALLAVAALLVILLAGMTFWNVNLQHQLATRPSAPIVYIVHGTGSSAQINGEAVFLPQQQETILIVHGLPRLSGTHIYQGWLLRNQQPTSIGTLSLNQGTAVLRFPGNLQAYEAIAVSKEPGPGASQSVPKGPIIMMSSLKEPATHGQLQEEKTGHILLTGSQGKWSAHV
ncbi:hypothetical protein EPA93_02515 [Ktedonosporobacter rubrisoli]|uniref:Regulator of SigK n=1 Tax=Ktedonosporobacter rubrisoli TaxID=2509675 RepID=A0A4P6K5S2_KTERU|nr:anti-sigma factor [Ktedonosporobacter rubrisoli]QBD83352.1 hypothetical protein EPA93_02515 [Ktedonosporobacter rubrisoli]